jgi:hypothetical protein
MKRKQPRATKIQETCFVRNWALEPTPVILKSDAVLVELPDDFKTLFKEGANSLELLGEGEEYFLKTREGTTPPTSIGIRVLGRSLLLTIEAGTVPKSLSVWIVMVSCSCHLVLSPTGVGYRKYILTKA